MRHEVIRSAILAMSLGLLPAQMAAASDDVIFGEKIGSSVLYHLNDGQCPPNMEQVYNSVVQEAAVAVASGYADAALLDYLLDNKDAMIADCEMLLEAVLVVETEERPTLFPVKTSGTIDGTTKVGRNSLGFAVAVATIQIAYSESKCHSEITGASLAGGAILGSCELLTASAPETKTCPRSERCLVRTKECATYHVTCKQGIFWWTWSNYDLGQETLCTACPA